jgi:lysophospholipase L1-like esterase
MKIVFYGDSLTEGVPGASFFALLRDKLPGHTLINYGRGGDTVISLHQRIVAEGLLEPADIAFVWVGVNDVLARLNPLSPILKTMLRQPWAKNPDEFRSHYRALLDAIQPYATHIVTVSPLLIGETLSNPWNQQLGVLSAIIEELSASYANVSYLDLRSIFAAKLAEYPPSSFLPTNLFRMMIDTVFSVSDEAVDRTSARRGLRLTLDGVHLNGRGAELVAESMAEIINKVRPDKHLVGS